MANLNPPHVLLNEEYANPVIYRMPSPASSIGTVYGLDDTAHSDTEYKISDSDAFNKEEFEADRDPLLTIPQSGGVPVRISERELDHVEERLLYDHVMGNLRQAVAQLEENELFEQTIRRGSQAALQIQPSTNDIDTLMRSMMVNTTSAGSRITNGPWNNFGKPAAVDRRDAIVASGDNMVSESTVGKRNRNGTSAK